MPQGCVGSNPTPRTLPEPTVLGSTPFERGEVLAKYLGFLLSSKSLKASTVERKVRALKSLLRHGVALNPESVISFLNTVNWSSGTKDLVLDAFKDYLRMEGLNVDLPKVRVEEKLPFIPSEGELESLIAATKGKTMVFLKLLKETALRPIEAWRLKWSDIDFSNAAITVSPAKYGKARKLKVSEETVKLLMNLPKKNSNVFSPSGNPEKFEQELNHFARNFGKIRRRLAERIGNERLKLISFRTFRHWKATTEYLKFRDIIYVKEFLGHKSITNTTRYIHLAKAITRQANEWICKTASNIEEAKQLIEQGFEYVTEMDGIKLFRKPKLMA
ncbi:MAG: site-specific integrase [Candidatus Bathyarchaeia archaeon]